MPTDIPVKYINATGEYDFQVVVFTKNFTESNSDLLLTSTSSTDDTDYQYVAWQVFNAQTEVDFVYPASVYVGAYYKTGILTRKAGPFKASLGSNWEVIQPETSDGVTILKENKDYELNSNGAISIKNTQPNTSWSGRSLNVGIYKAGYPLLIQKDVHVASQVEFIVKPIIYFGVVNKLKTGDTFTLSQLTSADVYEFDLSKFPNGVIVTLNEAPGGGGEYNFSAVSTIHSAPPSLASSSAESI